MAGPDPNDLPESLDEERVQVLEQIIQLLWDDQVALATTLIEKRKTTSTLLVVVVGLGIFQLRFFRSPDEQLAVSGHALLWIRVLLTGAVLAFLAGAYFLYTQRPFFRRMALRLYDIGIRRLPALYQTLEVAFRRRVSWPDDQTALPNRWPTGRAIRVMLPAEESAGDWVALVATEARFIRAERLREAYRRLERQNERVSQRLRRSVAMLFCGFALVVMAFAVYI